MIIVDRLIVGGIKFVLGKVAAAVETELTDDSHLREELLAAQMRLELGEIDEAEFAALETELLTRLREIRELRDGKAPAPGELKVTGIEATFGGDEHERE